MRIVIITVFAVLLIVTARSASANIQHVPVATWQAGPGASGVTGLVRAMAHFNGDLYVAGNLTAAGGVPVDKIARWSPADDAWSDVGGGLADGGNVWALTVFNDGRSEALYVGGVFDSISGVPAKNLARWDGEQWTPVITDMTAEDFGGAVLALRVIDGALYVGGAFTTIEGVTLNSIARYDPLNADPDGGISPWQPLGNGLHAVNGWGEVTAIAHFEDAGPGTGHGPIIYAGGYFTADGSYQPNKSFARFDPQSQTWSFPPGYMKFVNAMATLQGPNDEAPSLYVGGEFWFSSDGVYVSNIGRWDGQKWVQMPSIWDEEPYAWVYAVERVEDEKARSALIVGGNFHGAGPLHQLGNIVAWDGEQWRRLSSGVSGPGWQIRAVAAAPPLESDSTGAASVTVGGSFSYVEGQPVSNLAQLSIDFVEDKTCEHHHVATLDAAGPKAWTVAIAGAQATTVLVGDYDGEKVHVYERLDENDHTWSHVQTLTNPLVPGGWFGPSLAADGDTLAVAGSSGAWGTPPHMHLFQRDGENMLWEHAATIESVAGSHPVVTGDWLVIQQFWQPNQTVIYRRNPAGDWLHQQTLNVGGRIDFDGDRFLMGQSGKAVLYEWNSDDEMWQATAELVFNHPTMQHTGRVLLQGDLAFVSQPYAIHWGVIHVFERQHDGEWVQAGKVYAPASPHPIALHGNRLFVSAGNYDWGYGLPGSTFIYERVALDDTDDSPESAGGGAWVKRAWFSAGKVLAVAGDIAVVIDTDIEDSPSAARVFDISDCLDDAFAPTIPGDLTGDGNVGVPDLLILLGAWGPCADCNSGGCPADLTDDCTVGVPDLLILLQNWG